MGFDPSMLIGAIGPAIQGVTSLAGLGMGLYDRWRLATNPVLNQAMQTYLNQYNTQSQMNPYGNAYGNYGGMFGYYNNGMPVTPGDAYASMMGQMMGQNPGGAAIQNYQQMAGMLGNQPGLVDSTQYLRDVMGYGGQMFQDPRIQFDPAVNQGSVDMNSLGGGNPPSPSGSPLNVNQGGFGQLGNAVSGNGTLNMMLSGLLGSFGGGGGGQGHWTMQNPGTPAMGNTIGGMGSMTPQTGGITQGLMNLIQSLGSMQGGAGQQQPGMPAPTPGNNVNQFQGMWPNRPSPQMGAPAQADMSQPKINQSAVSPPQEAGSSQAIVPGATDNVGQNPGSVYQQLLANPMSFTPQIQQSIINQGTQAIDQNAMAQRRQYADSMGAGGQGFSGLWTGRNDALEDSRRQQVSDLTQNVTSQAALQNFQDMMGVGGMQLGAEQALAQQLMQENAMRNGVWNQNFRNAGVITDQMYNISQGQQSNQLGLMNNFMGLMGQGLNYPNQLLNQVAQMEFARISPTPTGGGGMSGMGYVPQGTGYYGGGGGGNNWGNAIGAALGGWAGGGFQSPWA